MSRLRGLAVVAMALVAGCTVAPARSVASTGPADVTATPGSWSSVVIRWTVPPDTARVELLRDGLLLDRFPSALGSAYTARLLWPSTTYGFQLKALDATGTVVAEATATATTPAMNRAVHRFFASSSFWNRPIGKGAATDPTSGPVVAASITAFGAAAVMNTNDHWGVPLSYAAPVSPLYEVSCRNPGCTPPVVPFRIPASARANLGSDGKLVVVDPGTGMELDMGRAVFDPVAGTWSTGNRVATPVDGWGAMCAQGQHCSGVLASGLAQFGGVVRPEEILQGHIDHALAMVSPYTNSETFVCPATRMGGGHEDPDAIPLGAHVQLDPAFDVDAQGWPTWERIVAKALQRYGAYVVDAGTTALEIRAESGMDRGYDPWAAVGVPSSWPGGPTLRDIPWDRVRLLRMQAC